MSKILVIDIDKRPQNPSFNISTVKGLIEGISYKYCKAIHRKDGYGYQ